jgi:hypothetical protein
MSFLGSAQEQICHVLLSYCYNEPLQKWITPEPGGTGSRGGGSPLASLKNFRLRRLKRAGPFSVSDILKWSIVM